MAFSPTLFQGAPLVVIDSCALKHLLTPVRPSLLASGDEKTLYIDTIVDAARQGFVQVGFPATVIYETSGHNPLNGQVVDRMFLDKKRSVLYHQGNTVRHLVADVRNGVLPNVSLMQSDEGVALLTALQELSEVGHRTRNYRPFSDFRKDADIDGLTRRAAQENIGAGGSALITEDHASREIIFARDAGGAKLAAGNLMHLFDVLNRNGVLPEIGFKETTHPEKILGNFRDYTTQLNDHIDRTSMRREHAAVNAYTRPVKNSGIESLETMVAEWLPTRAALVTPEIAAEIAEQPPWHHKGHPPIPLGKEAPLEKSFKKHVPRDDLRGGLNESGPADGWIR